MPPPYRGRWKVTKPRVITGKPPVGCQPIYLERGEDAEQGKHAWPNQEYRRDSEVNPDIPKPHYRKNQEDSGKTEGAMTPTRRAIFRSAFDPAGERATRGKK